MRLASLLLTLVVSSAAQERLRIEDAERIAIENHPRIAAAAAEAAASRASADQVRARQKPQLDVGVTASLAERGTRLGMGGLTAGDLFSRFGTGFSVSQLILDFGRNSLAFASALETARSRESSAQATRAEIRLQARIAFYRALQAQASRSIADELRKSRDVILRQTRTFAENELRSIVDVGFAEVRLSEAELLIIRTENERQAALIELATVMGLDRPGNWTLEEPVDSGLNVDVSQAIQQVITKRPDLAALRHQLEAARKQLESDRRLNFPTVAGTGVAGYIPFGDQRLRSRYAGAAVNITLPVFNGNAFSARRLESEARVNVVEKSYQDLLNRVQAAVRLSYLNLNTAQANMQVTRKLQEQAERTLRLTEARYTAGLGTIVEFNQAQTDAIAAQIGYVTSRYETGIRRARLDFEIGNLL